MASEKAVASILNSSKFNSAKTEKIVLPLRLHSIGHMMRLKELQLVYQIARDYVQPGRHIIDAGTFLGASAAAISAGLADRPDRELFYRKVHSYDSFINANDFYARFLHGSVELGGSFLAHFLDNIRPYHEYVNVYPGDFLKSRWIDQPIGFFFNDISKSRELDAHIWRHYTPHWLPGETIFVQQDFVHIQAPYVHVALGAVIDNFEPLAIVSPSIALRYATALTPKQIESAIHLARVDAGPSYQAPMIDALIARVTPLGNLEAVASLELIKSSIYHRAGQDDMAAKILHYVGEAFPDIESNYFHARVRHVASQIGIAAPNGSAKSDHVGH